MRTDCYGLPPTARALVRLCGLQATLNLVRRYGGQQIYVPRLDRLDPAGPIVECIGLEAATRLCAEFASTRVNVPLCPGALRAQRDREIWQSYMDGESCFKIAKRHGLTWRSVQKITYRIRMRGGVPDDVAGGALEQPSRQLGFAFTHEPKKQ